MQGKQFFLAALVLSLWIGGCSRGNKVTNLDAKTVQNAEAQAGFSRVTVDVDQQKGVVTLSGKVASPERKEQAGLIAQQIAGELVVANELSIEPAGVASQAREIETNIDDGIEKNFKALLIANRWDKERIAFKAKNGVLTLRGRVPDAQQRADVERVAATVPNVTEVVNELDVKGK